jgi:hypothetical protein
MPKHMARRARAAVGTLPLFALLAASVAVPAPAAAAQALRFVANWSKSVPDGAPISLSSPNIAVLHGAPAVVVGDNGGDVNALFLSNGATVPGWPANTGGVPVKSTPSVAPLSAGSPDDSVFVGAGTPADPHEGGYEAFNPNGSKRWSVSVHNPNKPYVSGIVASTALGDLQGKLAVVAPSVGDQEDAINASTGTVLPGFPWFTGDGDFATPALANFGTTPNARSAASLTGNDLAGSGPVDIINGGGQFPGIAFGTRFTRGGHVGVLRATGNAGTNNRHGGLICDYNPDQSVESSPAVGTFLPGGQWGIAVGTGDIFPGASDSGDVLVLGPHCEPVWARKLDGLTQSSPALADILGNGTLSVIEGTDNQRGGGSVWALNAQNGDVLWHTPVRGEVMGGCVTADLGGGYQDVIVATTGGAFVLDGRTGALLATLETGVGLQNSALVTDDPDGRTGVTLAGYNGYNRGVVEHFELVGSNGSVADEPGSWPMFHHDPTLSGNANLASGNEIVPAK